MSKPVSIIDQTINEIRNSQRLSGVRFVHGYTNTPFPNPLKKPVCSVHLHSAENHKLTYESDNKGTSCKLVFNMYVPALFGGYRCTKLLEDLSEVLIQINGDESYRECSISELSYDSNLHCYKGKLYLILTYKNLDEDAFPASTASSVRVRVNGSLLGLVQGVNIKKVNTGFNVYVYGQTKPYDTVLGSDKYIITLKRILLYKGFSDLSNIKNFVFSLETDNGNITYSNCNFSEITQSISNNKYFAEQAVITACSRSI